MAFKADAAKLKRWREERHWSQEHLSDLAGIGLRTLQRIENGDQASGESLKALAAAYNVDVSVLAIDPEIEAAKIVEDKNNKGRTALRLSLWIHLASYVLGVVVFMAINVSSGAPVMNAPLMWWTTGLVSHAATVAIVHLATGFRFGAKS